jgi:hypothetical protein
MGPAMVGLVNMAASSPDVGQVQACTEGELMQGVGSGGTCGIHLESSPGPHRVHVLNARGTNGCSR